MRFQRAVLVSLLVLFGLTSVRAQEPPIPPRRGAAPKVGLFIGFTPSWLKVDVTPVNEFLAGSGAAPLDDQGIFMMGGSGAIYILVIKNFRVGGMGLSGSTSNSGVDAAGIRRDVTLAVGLGGLTFEYVVPIVRRLDFAFGTMVGWGSTTLTLRQYVGRQSHLERGAVAFRNLAAQLDDQYRANALGELFCAGSLGECGVRGPGMAGLPAGGGLQSDARTVMDGGWAI